MVQAPQSPSFVADLAAIDHTKLEPVSIGAFAANKKVVVGHRGQWVRRPRTKLARVASGPPR